MIVGGHDALDVVLLPSRAVDVPHEDGEVVGSAVGRIPLAPSLEAGGADADDVPLPEERLDVAAQIVNPSPPIARDDYFLVGDILFADDPWSLDLDVVADVVRDALPCP